MKKSHVPVLVVGAGAAGTMLTLELARRGVNVRTDRSPAEAGRHLESDHGACAHARDPRAHRQAPRRSLSRARHSQQGLRAALRRRRRKAQRGAARHRFHDGRLALHRSCSCIARARRSSTCASTRARTTASRPTGTRPASTCSRTRAASRRRSRAMACRNKCTATISSVATARIRACGALPASSRRRATTRARSSRTSTRS